MFSQQDTTTLLKEVGNSLQKNQTGVSSILTDPKYLVLHPLTSFRDLIEKHAKAEPLKIAMPSEPGKKIRVLVTVTNKAGKPVPDAMVYLYQTDARGWYAADAPHVTMNEGDMRHARLFGYVKTDKNGKLELHTVKPSGYPRSDLPAHIHIHVISKDYRQQITELLFDDDERLVGDIRTRSVREGFLISKPETAPKSFDQQFTYSIVVRPL